MLYKIIYWFRKSLVNKFTVLLVLSVLIPIIALSAVIYKTTEKIIYENTFQAIQKDLRLVASNVEALHFQIIALSNNYYNNKELSHYLQKKYKTENVIEKFNDNLNVTKQIILPNASLLNHFSYTFVISKNGQVYTDFDFSIIESPLQSFYHVMWKRYLKNMDEGSYSLVWLNTENRLVGNRPMLTFARPLKDRLGNTLGQLLFFIDEAMMSGLFYEQGYDLEDQLMIINPHGEIISHIRKGMIGENIKELIGENNISVNRYTISEIDGEETLISTVPLSNMGWKIVNMIPTRKLFHKVNYIRNAILWTIAVIIIVTFFVGTLIIFKIATPLHNLKEKALAVSSGNLNIDIDITGNDEIGELSRCFHRMLHKIRELIQDIYTEQEMKAKSEIKAYQAQLNPHFLHNTLNNIKWVAISSQNHEIAEMIASLGDILESSMRNHTGIVKVREEIGLLESYIYLQKFRYKDRFEVTFHIDERIYEYFIPNLLLQPVIENSIFHGIGKQRFIQVDIYGEQKENELVFRLIDNGCGIPKEKIITLFDDAGEQNSRIGLLNIKRRVQLKFGKQYDVIVHSKLGEGTEVIINLPIIKEDK